MHNRFEAGLTDNQVQQRKSANYKAVECKKPWEKQFVKWTSKEQLGKQTHVHPKVAEHICVHWHVVFYLYYLLFIYVHACIYLCQ